MSGSFSTKLYVIPNEKGFEMAFLNILGLPKKYSVVPAIIATKTKNSALNACPTKISIYWHSTKHDLIKALLITKFI